eukprot:8508098-Prorocentrum_lima.AAC.1
MTSSLVGSEMCIRDSSQDHSYKKIAHLVSGSRRSHLYDHFGSSPGPTDCLLYTSDAADDM